MEQSRADQIVDRITQIRIETQEECAILAEAIDYIRSLEAFNDQYNQAYTDVTKELQSVKDRNGHLIALIGKILKAHDPLICDYCANHIECMKEQCEHYCNGVGDADGKFPNMKWSCEDFHFGTCEKLEKTPCNGCFENNYSGFCLKLNEEKRKIKLYLDGYADQGGASNPQFCGEFESTSLRDAVEQFAATADPEYGKQINWDRLTVWGYRFFEGI